MNLLDINLVEQPLDIDSFSYLCDEDYPFVLLGFQLKNLYDQKRLIIKKEYSPIDVIHLVPGETIMPKFFRGIKLSVDSKYSYLIKKIESLNLLKADINKNYYTDLLKEHNFTCNNCYAFLRKGVYPIDSEHLESICTTKLTQKDLYSNILDKESVNEFQALGYFVIYVLSNKNIYNTTTKNFLYSVVKNYNG